MLHPRRLVCESGTAHQRYRSFRSSVCPESPCHCSQRKVNSNGLTPFGKILLGMRGEAQLRPAQHLVGAEWLVSSDTAQLPITARMCIAALRAARAPRRCGAPLRHIGPSPGRARGRVTYARNVICNCAVWLPTYYSMLSRHRSTYINNGYCLANKVAQHTSLTRMLFHHYYWVRSRGYLTK